MAQGDPRDGKWRGKWLMEWVVSTLPRNMVYSSLLPLMRKPRLPVVDWTDAPADLNGLVSFAERRNLVSARVPSHFNWLLLTFRKNVEKLLPSDLASHPRRTASSMTPLWTPQK